MQIHCPQCHTRFRVDPAKIPPGGTRARCSVCSGILQVTSGADKTTPPVAPTTASSLARPGGGSAPGPPSFPRAPSPGTAPPDKVAETARTPFGSSDPQARARRLARALVSDIVSYHPERREAALRSGSLKREFREEIRKSWEEYVGQVGPEIAQSTGYFRDALNELLAGGRAIF